MFENTPNDPIKMGLKLIGVYLAFFIVIAIIIGVLYGVTSSIPVVGEVLLSKSFLSGISITLILFAVRLIIWLVDIKICFKDQYVNSLLIPRVLITIAVFLFLAAFIWSITAGNGNISAIQSQIATYENQIRMLPQDELGQTNAETIREQISFLKGQINYSRCVVWGNYISSLLLLPIIYKLMQKNNKQYRDEADV